MRPRNHNQEVNTVNNLRKLINVTPVTTKKLKVDQKSIYSTFYLFMQIATRLTGTVIPNMIQT